MGISTNSNRGLKEVVEMAGLDWGEARKHLDDDIFALLFTANIIRGHDDRNNH